MQKALREKENIKSISGYQLTTLLIRNGKKLNLKSSELLVFTALASYWNGKPVYPCINTLSENTALSEKAVRTAINGLIEKGYIIKSKRGKNANVYNININKVISTTECGKFDRTSAVESTAPCIKLNHDILNQQQTDAKLKPSEQKKNVVAFSSISAKKHKPITSDDVPTIIKTNKKIQNPCAYWASLSEEVKSEYRKKETEAQAAAKKIEEKKQAKNAEKERQRAEFEALKQRKQLPLTEQYTKNAAIEIVKKIHKITTNSTLANSLIDAFRLSAEELIQVQ